MANLAQRPVQSEIKAFLHLTIPLASAQVAQAATGFVDTVMMGWLGQETLAAGGLAATTFTALLVTATGVVVGVSPLVAEAYGAGAQHRIQQVTRQGFWLSLLVTVPLMLVLGQMNSLLRFFGQTDTVATMAASYLNIMLWAFFPALTFAMLKSVISSLSQPRPIIVIVVIGTVFNAIGNYVLGFGHLGFPALGLAGLAWASALSHWGMLLGLVVYMLNQFPLRKYHLFQHLHRIEPIVLPELRWVGLPIGISFALETGMFTITTYLMGALGTEVLAAHQIVFQTIVVIFMVPLGMSYATTIRVGQWNGQQNPDGVRRAAYVAMSLGALFMTLMAIGLLLAPQPIIGLYLNLNDPANAPVIALATSMLTVAALSQILDGVQTTAAGALRGLKDTRIPVLLSFVAFWGIGLACGYGLGFRLGLGGVGLWIGQLIGVAVSAGAFIWRFHRLKPSAARS